MLVALVDYGSGNLRSAAKAFERAARDADRAVEIVVTADAERVRRADRIVLPGVGAFADCRHGLDAVPGMRAALEEAVIRRAVPFLGICVGMQLMAERGHEHGVHDGLGWIAGDVTALAPAGAGFKIPHMGWNELILRDPGHPVLAGIVPGAHAYFCHSYRLVCADPVHERVSADYGGGFAAMVGRDTLVGVQFHPEKSQATGLRLIGNFLAWRP